jgi:hypothetical protein
MSDLYTVAEKALEALEKESNHEGVELENYLELLDLINERIEERAVIELEDKSQPEKVSWLASQLGRLSLWSILGIAFKVGVLFFIVIMIYRMIMSVVQWVTSETAQNIFDALKNAALFVPRKIAELYDRVSRNTVDHITDVLFGAQIEKASKPFTPTQKMIDVMNTPEYIQQKRELYERLGIQKDPWVELGYPPLPPK